MITLIILLILIPLFYALYYFGIMVARAGASWLRADLSLPTRWEGTTSGASGFMRRNFVVFRKYRQLSIETETNSGTIGFEVKGPDGSVLSPASGSYGRDACVLFDVGRLKRCSVTLTMKQFSGRFHIALQ